jgi:hypothetical protein
MKNNSETARQPAADLISLFAQGLPGQKQDILFVVVQSLSSDQRERAVKN